MAIRRNWADQVSVTSDGDSLIFTGIRMVLAGSDLLDESYARSRAEKGAEPLYVHISRLSNVRQAASSSLRFRYGAFYGEVTEHSWLSMEPGPEGVSETVEEPDEDVEEPGEDLKKRPSEKIVIRQTNSLLLKEIAALRAFLALLEPARNYDTSLSQSEERRVCETIHGHLSVLADQTKNWECQLATEIAVRKRLELPPDTGWLWSSVAQRQLERARDSLYRLCEIPDDDYRFLTMITFMVNPQSILRNVVATILNAFPPLLEWDFSGMFQNSGADLIFGIRPLIYHMIREDLLAKNEIRICRNKSCRKPFRADRRDQICCTPECSERVRSQKYYETKRKPERQARSAANNQQGTGREG